MMLNFLLILASGCQSDKECFNKKFQEGRHKICKESGVYTEKCDDFWIKMDNGYFRNMDKASKERVDEFLSYHNPKKLAEAHEKRYRFICIEELVDLDKCEKWIFEKEKQNPNFILDWYNMMEKIKKRELQRCRDGNHHAQCGQEQKYNTHDIKNAELEGERRGFYMNEMMHHNHR